MKKLAAIISTVALLPGTTMSAPADVGRAVLTEQETIVAATQIRTEARPPATETLRGVVEVVDQGNDTIRIRLPQGVTEQFKVQDGLLFDAVRYGDQVEVTVANIGGTKTIVGLTEQ